MDMVSIVIIFKGVCKICVSKIQRARFVRQYEAALSQHVRTGRIKELMSAPAECYQQLEEFLAPYEELRWMHEVHVKQYHSAYTTLTSCANNEQQSLSKQKVM